MAKNIGTSIFKKHSVPTSSVESVNLPALFSNFFIIKHDGHCFLQLGLKQVFGRDDNFGHELPAVYQSALQKMTEHLAQLKLIPNDKNYCLRGIDIMHTHTPDRAHPFTTLYDATPLTHLVVELSTANALGIEKLATSLNKMSLAERKNAYPIYEAGHLTNKKTENTAGSTSQPTRRF